MAATKFAKPAVTINCLSEPDVRDIFQAEHIPVFDGATDACFKMLRAYIDYGQFLERRRNESAAARAENHGKKAVQAILYDGKNGSMLPHEATAQLLGAYGFACAEFKIACGADEAASAAAKIGYPVILKGIAPDIAHRSDAGLVSGKIDDEAALRRSFATLQRNLGAHARAEVSVERYLPHDFEVILGVKYDETFGPVVLCGLGGIFTEVLKDYALRLAPLTGTQAEDMLSSLKTFAALKKSTNGTAHIERLIKIIVNLSDLAVDLRGKIRAVDINPIGITLGSPAITVLDAKVHL